MADGNELMLARSGGEMAGASRLREDPVCPYGHSDVEQRLAWEEGFNDARLRREGEVVDRALGPCVRGYN